MPVKQAQTAIVMADAADYPMLSLEPSELREAITDNLMGETLAFKDLRRVKVPAGGAESWSVPAADGGKPIPTNDFQGVIIHTELTRVMWLADQPSKTGAKGPDCSGKLDADGVFHGSRSIRWIKNAAETFLNKGNAAEPAFDSGPRQACDQCPFAQFGSGKQGRGQKCQKKRVIFIATDDSLLPMVLIAPVMSLDNAKKYLLGLSSTVVPTENGRKRMMKYYEVITNFGLEADSNGENDFARVTFTRAAVLPEVQRQAFTDYRKTIMPFITNLAAAAVVADATEPVDNGNDFDIDAPGEMESQYEYIPADDDEALPTDDD
jgi:hypothetical protein